MQMVEATKKNHRAFPRIMNFAGLALAVAAFLYSAYYIHWGLNPGSDNKDELITLTVAHWQMEEGAREGWDRAFRIYEEIMARRGVKLAVRQTVVPFRGYRQWFKTQLVGGKPADIVRPLGPDSLLNQYMVPLSPFIDDPNPWNENTVLEGMPWRDTIIDGMAGALNVVYADYFTVDMATSTIRLFGNLDIIEAATGERRMPQTYAEWMDMGAAIKRYSEQRQEPIIPITGQIDQYGLHYYYSEMNGHLYDLDPYLSGEPGGFDAYIYRGVHRGEVNLNRFFGVGLLLQDMQGLVDASYDTRAREEITFLFFDGRLAFYLTGSWEANSIIANSPFEVGISALPSLNGDHALSKFFTGRVSELGAEPMGEMGITKASAHPQLALDLLRFMSSYEINQMVMYERKWLPAVRDAQYPENLRVLKPQMGGTPELLAPYFEKYGSYRSRTEMRKAVSSMLKGQVNQPGDLFLYEKAVEIQPIFRAEAEERVNNSLRAKIQAEANRSALSLGLLRLDMFQGKVPELNHYMAISEEQSTEGFEVQRGKLEDRLMLSKEGISRQTKRLLMYRDLIEIIDAGEFLVPPDGVTP